MTVFQMCDRIYKSMKPFLIVFSLVFEILYFQKIGNPLVLFFPFIPSVVLFLIVNEAL